MIVADFMSSPPITVTPDVGYRDALHMMKEKKIRRLPVVSRTGWLVGIVSERDLLYVSPSPVSSLNIWETNSLLADVCVETIMTKENLHIARPEMPVQEVAQIMLDHKIGGLPVLDETKQVVAVITESDIFRALIRFNEAHGALHVVRSESHTMTPQSSLGK